jgi:predicted transcriptional regulator
MDLEKTMQFLLEQQARFDARQAEFDARQAEFGARHAELLASQAQSGERMTRIENVLLGVATAQERTNEILATLTERHVELAQSHRALSEARRVTEQNLNALISAAERHIASHN